MAAGVAARLQINPAETLPMLFAHAVPPVVGMLGLAAIVGAVTSSFSSSILSAGAMFSWNCLRRIVWPDLSVAQMARVIRGSILLFGGLATCARAESPERAGAVVLHERPGVRAAVSAAGLCALRSESESLGSMAAFVVSLVLRIGAGEPLFGIPPVFPYPEWWPVRTVAAVAGLVILPVVSRLTERWVPARP